MFGALAEERSECVGGFNSRHKRTYKQGFQHRGRRVKAEQKQRGFFNTETQRGGDTEMERCETQRAGLKPLNQNEWDKLGKHRNTHTI